MCLQTLVDSRTQSESELNVSHDNKFSVCLPRDNQESPMFEIKSDTTASPENLCSFSQTVGVSVKHEPICTLVGFKAFHSYTEINI